MGCTARTARSSRGRSCGLSQPDESNPRLCVCSCARERPVPAQMWQGRAQSRRRCGRGEPSPGADVGGRRRQTPGGALPAAVRHRRVSSRGSGVKHTHQTNKQTDKGSKNQRTKQTNKQPGGARRCSTKDTSASRDVDVPMDALQRRENPCPKVRVCLRTTPCPCSARRRHAAAGETPQRKRIGEVRSCGPR
jgi:hypothetical protein